MAVRRSQSLHRRGEIFGLVGPDGAGKTTTMRMLAGVMRPDAGTIIMDGVDVAKNPDLAKAHVSYMPSVSASMKISQLTKISVSMPILFAFRPTLREERAARLLAASDMTPFRGRLAGQLSGGMKQKLGLPAR